MVDRTPSTDDELVEYLGPGQLIGDPDVDGLEVTFKLHECYPGSRYIVTDTSAPPMAVPVVAPNTFQA